MKYAEKTALEYLEKNALFHMGMIFPIKRGSADIIYAGSDGAFMRERKSGAYMLSSDSFSKAKELVDKEKRHDLFCVFQKDAAEYLLQKHNYEKCMENHQAVYMSKEPVAVKSTELNILPLALSHLDTVYAHYHDDVDYDYLSRRLEEGAIYGGFLDDELCGFAGTHEEGSIGILKVFEKFRRRGFAEALEGFMVNQFLAKGLTPFAQVKPDNGASLTLHEKLGFRLSKDKLYWLFD